MKYFLQCNRTAALSGTGAADAGRVHLTVFLDRTQISMEFVQLLQVDQTLCLTDETNLPAAFLMQIFNRNVPGDDFFFMFSRMKRIMARPAFFDGPWRRLPLGGVWARLFERLVKWSI